MEINTSLLLDRNLALEAVRVTEIAANLNPIDALRYE